MVHLSNKGLVTWYKDLSWMILFKDTWLQSLYNKTHRVRRARWSWLELSSLRMMCICRSKGSWSRGYSECTCSPRILGRIHKMISVDSLECPRMIQPPHSIWNKNTPYYTVRESYTCQAPSDRAECPSSMGTGDSVEFRDWRTWRGAVSWHPQSGVTAWDCCWLTAAQRCTYWGESCPNWLTFRSEGWHRLVGLQVYIHRAALSLIDLRSAC